MSAFLSPIGGAGAQFFNNVGDVLAGGKLYTYLAGSTTPKATWTTGTQAVPNANPVILGSDGRPANEIWLEGGTNNYKFSLTDSNDVLLGTWDNITGIAASNALQSEWVPSGLTPTYISPNSFSVQGNQSTIFSAYRRLQIFLGSGAAYGSVVSTTFALGVTTVVTAMDSTPIDATISAVSYGFVSSTNPSLPSNYIKQGDAINGSSIGQSVPAAGTFTNLNSPNVNITGGTITGIAGFSVPDFLLINQGVI